jgi:hypothetical protein
MGRASYKQTKSVCVNRLEAMPSNAAPIANFFRERLGALDGVGAEIERNEKGSNSP